MKAEVKEVMFNYRNKEWKLVKEAHGFSLQSSLAAAGEWQIVGYYSCIRSIIVRLITEHFISSKDGKEMIIKFDNTCDELAKALNKALG